MKLRILTDLHVDHNRDYKIPNIEANNDEIVIDCGDTASSYEIIKGFYKSHFLKSNKNIFIFGNHSSWNERGKSVSSYIEMAKKNFNKNSHTTFLENDYVIINDVVFIGCTGWTDYGYFGDSKKGVNLAYQSNINDWPDFYYNYKDDNKNINFEWMIKKYNESIDFINKTCKKFKDKKIVLITHFPMSTKMTAEKYKGDSRNVFFINDNDKLYFDNPNIILHFCGHIHNFMTAKINNCIIVANPLGYLSHGEGKNYQQNLIIDLDKLSIPNVIVQLPIINKVWVGYEWALEEMKMNRGLVPCVVTKERNFKSDSGHIIDLPYRQLGTYPVVETNQKVLLHINKDWNTGKLTIIDIFLVR